MNDLQSCILKLALFIIFILFFQKCSSYTPETAGINLKKINFVLSKHLSWSFT